MNLGLTDEQVMLRDSARRFLADHYDFARRSERIAEPGYSRPFWTSIAELGWLGVGLPEAAGGLGGDGVDVAMIATELGRVLAVEPYLAGLMGAALLADLEPTSPLLADSVSGTQLIVAAHWEGRLDAPIATQARQEGDIWVLTGAKRTVLDAASADHILVSATTAEGIGVFRADPAADGLEIEPFQLVDGRRAAHIRFSLVRCERVGGDAAPALATMEDRMLAAACAEMLGGLESLVEQTRDYCRTRVQFQKALSEFQVVRHRLAEMSIALEEARAATLMTAVNSNGDVVLRRRSASAAKAKVGRAARFIAREAVQLHGGMGVTEELSIGAYYKHSIAFDALFGAVEHHDRAAAAAVRTQRVDAGEAVICRAA